VRLSGQIVANDTSCEDNEFIQITRRLHGTRNVKDFRDTLTDTNGQYRLSFRVNRNADYRATATSHDNCAEASSSPISVLVKVRVSIKANDRTPRRGGRVRITVQVSPDKDRTRVILQQRLRRGRGYVTAERKRLNRRSRAVFVVDVEWKKRDFRAKWPQQNNRNEGNKSKKLTIRSRRR
jgi:hypothetical protein